MKFSPVYTEKAPRIQRKVCSLLYYGAIFVLFSIRNSNPTFNWNCYGNPVSRPTTGSLREPYPIFVNRFSLISRMAGGI